MRLLPNDAATGSGFAENMALLLRTDLAAYVHRAFLELYPSTTYRPAHYVRAICHALEWVARGEVRRLLLLPPPLHLKSHCASVAFSAWFLGRHHAAQLAPPLAGSLDLP